MIIHHILSIVKPSARSGISNVKINLVNIKIKDYGNDVILAKKQVKVCMEEIKGSNNWHDDILLHIFQLYHSAPDPVFREYIQEKRNK